MWNHRCIFLYYFHTLQSCHLNLNIYAKWNWYLYLYETNDLLHLLTLGCSVVPVLHIVKAIVSPTNKATAFLWWTCFHLYTGSALGILLHYSVCRPQWQHHTVLQGLSVSAKAVLLTLFFFFGIVLASLDSFLLHKNFRISLSSSTKKPVGIFIGIALNLCIRLRRTGIFTHWAS